METDPVFCKSLKWLLDNEIGLDEPVVDFDFTANREGFGINEVIELIPDGKKTQVNDNNKDLYVSLQLHWRVNGSISSQIKFLKQGFSEVIPLDEVSVFDPNELLLLLNGKSVVVTAEIQIACRYTGGYDKESESIVLFWETFESMSQDERRAILKFATGASRVPLDGFDPEFTITKSEFDANALPSAHTCFNQLVLPPYKNAKNLKEKLLIAVQTVGFQLT
jgi:E3 ubiquitin-protein ligase HUWE1